LCGIAGKVSFTGGADHGLVERMCAAMEHRGPDSRGVFRQAGVAMGVQRLAIIDVAGGDQPIFNEDRSVAVVMNGEIYNFQELRSSLIKSGHRFSSGSDTEVLVHLYEEHGKRMVDELRGMFAFAVWDSRRRRLLCARDRVGKKPLFWTRKGDTVWFASELRALLEDPTIGREPNLDAISAYLALGYVPDPLCAVQGVEKLPPASILTVSATSTCVESYWSLDYGTQSGACEEELSARVWHELVEATRIRLMSEVPLGALLSGGVDSSAVVAAMAECASGTVKTFSIGFPDAAYDELEYARLVAERYGTDHHEFVLEPSALEILPQIARQYGEPFADSSAIPTFYLAQLAGRHVTVVLNGDGGDEAFAGYARYVYSSPPHLAWLPRPLQRVAPFFARALRPHAEDGNIRTKAKRLAEIMAMSEPARYATAVSLFDRVRRQRITTPDFNEAANASVEALFEELWLSSTAPDRIGRMMDVDSRTYLPGDLLVKMDIATMAHSVEARSPFLDQQLMQVAASFPSSMKLRGGVSKWILKKALRGRLPDAILDRSKRGFSVPLDRWFREELSELPPTILLDPQSLDRGYFRREALENLIREHRQGVANHSSRLWALLQLELWHREVAEGRLAPESGLDAHERTCIA
jgi:asparagine synthase (glutamine-hydrolysing)